jgi:hypothetical protein
MRVLQQNRWHWWERAATWDVARVNVAPVEVGGTGSQASGKDGSGGSSALMARVERGTGGSGGTGSGRHWWHGENVALVEAGGIWRDEDGLPAVLSQGSAVVSGDGLPWRHPGAGSATPQSRRSGVSFAEDPCGCVVGFRWVARSGAVWGDFVVPAGRGAATEQR